MRESFEWSDTNNYVESYVCILAFLATQIWCTPANSSMTELEKVDDLGEIKATVESITAHFREPLEAKVSSYSVFKMKLKKLLNIQEIT